MMKHHQTELYKQIREAFCTHRKSIRIFFGHDGWHNDFYPEVHDWSSVRNAVLFGYDIGGEETPTGFEILQRS